jgi:hypothetical protein
VSGNSKSKMVPASGATVALVQQGLSHLRNTARRNMPFLPHQRSLSPDAVVIPISAALPSSSPASSTSAAVPTVLSPDLLEMPAASSSGRGGPNQNPSQNNIIPAPAHSMMNGATKLASNGLHITVPEVPETSRSSYRGPPDFAAEVADVLSEPNQTLTRDDLKGCFPDVRDLDAAFKLLDLDGDAVVR